MIMNGEAIVSIGTVIIALIGAVITYIIKPYIEANTTEKQRNNVVFWVRVGVNAAEQMKEAGLISIPKKDYVVKFLNEKGIEIDENQLDALIEAAVFELNKNK